jgi:glycosyltransferase involved in cell wall biosynthesis
MMKDQLSLQLPNLNDYKQEFIKGGVTLPLPIVPFSETGLLSELPLPPSGKTGWPWTVETEPFPATLPDGSSYPKLSIVMPSYNQGQFIEETIRSVLLQNYPNLEFVICDGGSGDETKKLLEKYSSWISFWQAEKDRGQGHAINLGFSLASGVYYGWINSDDFYLPGCFHSVASYALNHFVDFIYGDGLIIYNSEHQLSYWRSNLALDRYLRFGGLIASHSSFWKSNIHQPIWEEMNCNVDGELWIRLLPGRTKYHLKIPLGVFRVQPQAKTANDKYHHLWKKDDEAIANVYGNPPKIRSYLAYEFVYVQRLYKSLTNLLAHQSLKQVIQSCGWTDQVSENIGN